MNIDICIERKKREGESERATARGNKEINT